MMSETASTSEPSPTTATATALEVTLDAESQRTGLLVRNDVTVGALRVLARRKTFRHSAMLFGRSLIPPIFHWARSYRLGDLRYDALAGLTVAVMLIPQSIAYAFLAGLPAEYGLYASFVPLLCYSFFASSMQMAVGLVALASLLTASAVATVQAANHSPISSSSEASAFATSEVVRLATASALITGIFTVAMGLFNIGGLIAGFLSGPVLTGYISASAVIVVLSQIGPLLGVSVQSSQYPVLQIADIVVALPHTNWPTLLIGIGCIAILIAVGMIKKLPRWFPTQLLLAFAGVLCGLFIPGLQSRAHVALVGYVPSGLLKPSLPSISWSEFKTLTFPCVVIAVVCFVNAYALAAKLATKHGTQANSNAELIAFGIADFVGSFFGAHPIGGSLSRTALNDSLGARTPVANAITGMVVLVAMFTLTPAFKYLPKVVLSAIVVASVIKLVDISDLRRLWKIDKTDFVLELVSILSTLLAGLSYGIFISIGASLLSVVFRSSSPTLVVLGRVPGKSLFRNVSVFRNALAFPGVAIIRIDAELYFANISDFRSSVLELANEARGGLRALVIDGSNISHIDSVALDGLSELSLELRKMHCFVVLSSFHSYAICKLKAAGVAKVFMDSISVFSRMEESHESAKPSPLTEWKCFTDSNEEAIELIARICHLSIEGVPVDFIVSEDTRSTPALSPLPS